MGSGKRKIMIYLYNENFLLGPKIKSYFKRILKGSLGGPHMVQKGLMLGLDEIQAEYRFNESPFVKGSIACVLNGVETLKWAFEQKNKGYFKYIVAGPNIAMPDDYAGIIFDSRIDVLLVPCAWAKDFCTSFSPKFSPKIKIWAAGVETCPDVGAEKVFKRKCLVYYKNKNLELLKHVCKTLELEGFSFQIVEYGKYAPNFYNKLLRAVDFGVFLTDSESQGLAIHEAWMMNVPTLVWKGGHMKFKKYEWLKSSPAPYLGPECGMFFPSSQEFASILGSFVNDLKKFSPRKYHLENFTLKKTAQKYLEIIENL